MADLLEPEHQPWERQRGEPSRAFAAFARYRDMGAERRSLRRLAEEMGVSLRLVSRWSRKHHWVERCAAWDDEVDRLAREEQVKAIAEMKRRHAEAGMAMIRAALERLATMDREQIDASAVVRLLAEGVKIERLARGEPETVQQQQITGQGGGPVRVAGPDLSKLTDAELAQLEALLSKAGEGDADTSA